MNFSAFVSSGVLSGILAGAAVQIAAAGSEQRGPLLYFSQAQCLKQKAEMYRDAAINGPALIFVGFCEQDIVTPAPGQISADSTLNSLQDSVIRFTEKQMRDVPGLGNLPANMKAVVVVLSWDQITCIRDNFAAIVDDIEGTEFSRESHSGTVSDSVAELRLNDCGK